MARSETASAIIDGILRCAVAGGAVSLALLAPNIISVLDKPTRRYFQSLDKRAQERELRRLGQYMQRQGLLTDKYEHGLAITAAGRRRLKRVNFANLEISTTDKWDGKWRLVFFDIPETKRDARVALTQKLRALGFQLLQQSIWIHPYPSRTEVEAVCEAYHLSSYVTYIVTAHIDHERKLKQRFATLLNSK